MHALEVFFCWSVPDGGMSLVLVIDELAQMRELTSRSGDNLSSAPASTQRDTPGWLMLNVVRSCNSLSHIQTNDARPILRWCRTSNLSHGCLYFTHGHSEP
jgi:hypothetical protein